MSNGIIKTFEDLSPTNKIKKGKVKLKQSNPFFGTLVGYLEVVETNSLPTAGVTEDGKLFYNPDFIDSLTLEETKAILAHEVLHPGLKLFERQEGRDHSISNQAHDLIINYMLVHQNEFELPNSPENFEHTIPDPDEVPEPFNDIVRDEKERIKNSDDDRDFVLIPDSEGTYENPENDVRIENIHKKSYETVYSELYQETDGDGLSQSGQRATITSEGDGNVRVSIGGDEYVISEEEFPVDIDDKKDGTESKDWDEIMSHAESNATHRGEKPGGLEDLVNSDEEDRIDYEKYIQSQLSNIVPDDYTFRRKSDSGRGAGIYLPDTKKKSSVDLIVVVDTSGSISDRILEVFTGEIRSICRTFESVNITVIQHDYKVQKTEEYNNARISDFDEMKIEGRGGTSHIPVFEEIEDGNYGERFFVVCLTDGYTEVPDEIPIQSNKLLWVLNNYEVKSDRLKHGKIARINLDE